MKNIFNKSVIAVALLGAFAVSAGEVDFSAASLTVDATVANQGNDGVAAGTTEGAILVAKELLDNASSTANKTLTRTSIIPWKAQRLVASSSLARVLSAHSGTILRASPPRFVAAPVAFVR